MTAGRILLFVFTQLIGRGAERPVKTLDLVNALRTLLREEFLFFFGRIFTGLILSAVLIMSCVLVAQSVQEVLAQFSSGTWMTLGLFTFCGLACGAVLFRIFGRKTVTESPIRGPSIDIQKLATAFIEGFVEGAESAQVRAQGSQSRESVPEPELKMTNYSKKEINSYE